MVGAKTGRDGQIHCEPPWHEGGKSTEGAESTSQREVGRSLPGKRVLSRKPKRTQQTGSSHSIRKSPERKGLT